VTPRGSSTQGPAPVTPATTQQGDTPNQATVTETKSEEDETVMGGDDQFDIIDLTTDISADTNADTLQTSRTPVTPRGSSTQGPAPVTPATTQQGDTPNQATVTETKSEEDETVMGGGDQFDTYSQTTEHFAAATISNELSVCQQKLRSYRKENKRQAKVNKRQAEVNKRQADEIKRLKQAIRVLIDE